ncbi:hypothetical protein C2845_PM07G12520 [Panicum miliaceum]|uniref:Uncharacterized protein n=1 Tax=Panicum miliaceum TaxID=4540 RepID=A0A3L6SS25_PANMI|nr:hypothetical protein C2845_PM07G12520 [Panicum miliaceum]
MASRQWTPLLVLPRRWHQGGAQPQPPRRDIGTLSDPVEGAIAGASRGSSAPPPRSGCLRRWPAKESRILPSHRCPIEFASTNSAGSRQRRRKPPKQRRVDTAVREESPEQGLGMQDDHP